MSRDYMPAPGDRQPEDARPLPGLDVGSGDPADPIVIFARLHRSTRIGDFRAASQALRDLRACGYSVVPLPHKGDDFR